MQSKKLAGAKPPSTQKYLDIAEIRDDVVLMRDGTLRAVLLVSSLNFALKSEDEQNGIIAGYVNFLNSFEFPLQIVIQSRRLNIDPYIDRLKQLEREQTNELLKMQTKEYLQFIQQLLELENIMAKRFYAVVPYSPLSDKQRSFWVRFQDLFTAARSVRLQEEKFQERKKDLLQRVTLVQSGLQSMGLHVAMLQTQSLMELYYATYNPTESEREKLPEIDKMRIE